VLRGGAPAAHLFINQRRSASEFLTDWTAVHELSHLFLPYLRPEDAWLSEGTASYYQHVLRARSGMIAPAEAWQNLHTGFRRGMKSQPNVTLADATEGMYRNGAYLRVYWEGAAIMLLADQRLRTRTSGSQSLDSALRQLRECCVASETGWQAAEVFAKLDEVTGTTVFRELYETNVRAEAFPDLAEAYGLLGLQVQTNGETIELQDDDGAKVRLRDSIMGVSKSVN
jgi:predicted metalloprotease with PDZ domain